MTPGRVDRDAALDRGAGLGVAHPTQRPSSISLLLVVVGATLGRWQTVVDLVGSRGLLAVAVFALVAIAAGYSVAMASDADAVMSRAPGRSGPSRGPCSRPSSPPATRSR